MSFKNFFKSLKGMFWFGSRSKDVDKRASEASIDDHDIFFLRRDVEFSKEDFLDLESWLADLFDEPKISVDDPDIKRAYMLVTLSVKTSLGDLHLVYYENGELVLRGDREAVTEVKEPLEEKLGFGFKRV